MHARRYPPQSTLPNSTCVWKRRFSIDTKESENRHKRLEYIQREWREKEKETRERTKQETSRNSLPASILFHSCCHCELQGDQNQKKNLHGLRNSPIQCIATHTRRICVRQEEEEEVAERKRMPPPGEERVYLQEGRKEEVFLHVSRDRRRQKRHLSDHDLPPIYPHLTRDVITRTQKASNSGGKKKKNRGQGRTSRTRT
jgi:hypothetical protein